MHVELSQEAARYLDMFAAMIKWHPESIETYVFFRKVAQEFRCVCGS